LPELVEGNGGEGQKFWALAIGIFENYPLNEVFCIFLFSSSFQGWCGQNLAVSCWPLAVGFLRIGD
jgi:hypothetical protein